MRECSVQGCSNKYYGKGFCKKHHQWHWTRGLLPESKTDIEVFWERVDKRGDDDCWNWIGGKDTRGYGSFKRGEYGRAHRFSYAMFIGEIPEGLHVRHKCNNPSCVNPKHLCIGTHQENMKDMARSGVQKGENKACTVINEKIAHEVMDRLLTGEKQCDVSKITGVAICIVKSIAYGKSWIWSVGMPKKVEEYKSLDKSASKPRGSERYNSKLTEDDAVEIFNSIKTHKVIAKEFGVSKTLVSNIKNKRSWKHIHQKEEQNGTAYRYR